MKKYLSTLLAVILCLLPLLGVAATGAGFISFDSFGLRHTLGSVLSGLYVDLPFDDMEITDATSSSVVGRMDIDEYSSIVLNVVQDKEGNLFIDSIMLFCAGDGSQKSGEQILYTIAGIIYACGGVETMDEVGDFFKTMGMMDDGALADGGKGSYEHDGIRYSWSSSDIVGLLFTVEKA